MGLTTALTVVSVVSSVAGSIKSGKQAREARTKANEAEAAAKEAMAEARSKLDVNFYDALSVNVDTYNQERDNLLSSVANLSYASQQGESRGIGATAQQLLIASQKSRQSITDRQAKEIADIELLQAEQDIANRDALVKLDEAEAKGAVQMQQAALEAEGVAREQQMSQLGDALELGMTELAPLYGKKKEVGINDMEINPIEFDVEDDIEEDVID